MHGKCMNRECRGLSLLVRTTEWSCAADELVGSPAPQRQVSVHNPLLLLPSMDVLMHTVDFQSYAPG